MLNALNSHTEHPFAQYIRILGKGKTGQRSLSFDEAAQAFTMILNDEVDPMQIGALLMLLRVKEESADELAGFVSAVKQQLNHQQQIAQRIDIDWPSYSGKRKHYPWFILAALTLSKHGFNIVMHGVTGHTPNRLYTAQALAALDILPAYTEHELSEQLDQHHFAYIDISYLHPVLAHLLTLKPIFGVRSPVHTLVRLINPFNAKTTLQSVFHPSYRLMHQQAALKLNYEQSAVFKGEGGEIERNPDARTTVFGVHQGSCYDLQWPMINTTRSPITAEFNLHEFKAVWEGRAQHDYGEKAIIGTTAIALYTMRQATTPEDAEQLAKHLWHTRHVV